MRYDYAFKTIGLDIQQTLETTRNFRDLENPITSVE